MRTLHSTATSIANALHAHVCPCSLGVTSLTLNCTGLQKAPKCIESTLVTCCKDSAQFYQQQQQIRLFTLTSDVYYKHNANDAAQSRWFMWVSALTTRTLIAGRLVRSLHVSCHIPTSRWQHIYRYRPGPASWFEIDVVVYLIFKLY